MLGQSRKDKATETAARHEAYTKTFAGQLNILKKCQAGDNHTPVFDKNYGHHFCTTCETQTD